MGAKQKGGAKAPEKKKVIKLDKKPSSGAKAKKKKWSKGKVREKLDHKSYMEAAVYDKAIKEIPKMTLVTPAVVSERYKIRASASKILIRELIAQNQIKPVVQDSTRLFCTRMTKDSAL